MPAIGGCRMRLRSLSVAVLALAGVAWAGDAAPVLDAESFPRWLAHLTPAEREQRWTAIPWRASVWPALTEAQAADRPVLVWAMNGHPLACT